MLPSVYPDSFSFSRDSVTANQYDPFIVCIDPAGPFWNRPAGSMRMVTGSGKRTVRPWRSSAHFFFNEEAIIGFSFSYTANTKY